MHDPMSAGRRLASRALAWQAVATALVALLFLARGVPSALGAVAGGGALVAGGAAAMLVALGGGVQPAGMAFGRLLAGTMLKWVVVLAVLGFALGGAKLPPLPMLAGLVAATLAYLLANLSKK